MLPGQLDLFGECTVPSTGLIGVRLRWSSPCTCGSAVVTVGASGGPHSAAIRCDKCRKHRGWLARAEFERISTIVGESGRPSEPIDIS